MDEHELDDLRMEIDKTISKLTKLQRQHEQETGKHYVVGGGYSVPIPGSRPSGYPLCELCGGETDLIGMEGDIAHVRCRSCHMDQEVSIEDVIPGPEAFTVRNLPSRRPNSPLKLSSRRLNARPTYQAHRH